MALPNPSTTWKLIRFILRQAPYVIPAAVSYLEDQLDANESHGAVEWMRWVCIATRATPAGTSEDRIQFKFDIVNITGGAVDTSWTTADFTSVRQAMNTFLATCAASMPTTHSFVQHRAYQMAYNPTDPGPGNRSKANGWAFAPTGPPRYVYDYTTPGSGTTGQIYQAAISVTLRTGWPRHWGRFYLPPPAATAIDTNGRIQATNRTNLANGALLLGKTLSDLEFLPVVPVTDLNKQAFHALLGVNQYVVDDIPDVQRRRRPRMAANRTIGV